MKIAVAYIAVTNGKVTDDFASRFCATYRQFPGGEPHSLTVVCNGGPLPRQTGLLFAGIKCSFYPRANTPGWDIDGYRDFARITDADMLCCFGESVHFHRAGWLTRIAEAWTKHGPGMYSPFGSHSVRAHLGTTAFICPPKKLLEYPMPTRNKQERYAFEHGPNSFWRWLRGEGMPAVMVTWDGEWHPGQWRFPPNILWRGDQSNCLMFCSHTDDYDRAPQYKRRGWEKYINRPFR